MRTVSATPARRSYERALSAVGSASSGLGDIAINHDDYLDEIYGS